MNPEALLAMGGPPPGMVPPPPGSELGAAAEGPPTDLSPVDALRNALEAMETYQGVEQDDIDLAKAAKIYAQIQDLLAENQRQQEAAMGTTAAHKGMARALRNAGG